MKTTTVYGLRSSRDKKIRYIGQTVSALRQRLAGHLHSVNRAKTPVAKWINREIKEGFKIEIFVICEGAILHKTEKWLIRMYKWVGEKLLNVTDGGEGTLGFKHYGRKRPDLAERNRLGAGKPGHKWSDEDRAMFSEKHRGKKCPWNAERNKKHLSWLGRKHTEEEKKKIGLAHKEKMVSQETKEKIRSKALERSRFKREQTTLLLQE